MGWRIFFDVFLSLTVLWGFSFSKVVAIHPGFVDTPALGTHHVQPFLMTAHDAAMEVLLAVASDSSHYGFPLLMEHGLMRIARFVPNVIFDFVMYNSTR